MKLLSVVGARPNFMKIAPFIKAIENYNVSNPNNTIEHILVHTGQHYDTRMSDSFFKELGIPNADINLEIGSGSHAYQVGRTMIEFEKTIQKIKPDWVIVVGDVNATLACSITAKKEGIRCCHVEAGLRSGDMSMPEEINRLVTDRISDLLLTPDSISSQNLFNEGIDKKNVNFVGNIMIDTLEMNRRKASELKIEDIIQKNLIEEDSNIGKTFNGNSEFALLTMHRPSNVDDIDVLSPLCSFIRTEVTKKLKVIWPIHPRTVKKIQEFGLWQEMIECKDIFFLHPISYQQMLRLNMDAKIMLTDSGGLQEECCVLGTPCLTLRWNTERPVTLQEYGGASILVGNNIQKIKTEFYNTLDKNRIPQRPELWDGHAAERILEAIINHIK